MSTQIFRNLNYRLLLLILIFSSCKSIQNIENTTRIKSLRFIGEQIIPTNLTYKNTNVGGFSSIDYANGKYYCISDDKQNARIYVLDLSFNEKVFQSFNILDVINIDVNLNSLDPEALRVDDAANLFFTSEGNVRKQISPQLFKINDLGKVLKTIKTPEQFNANKDKNYGSRQNGTFEGLTFSNDKKSLWLGMELPLKQDGDEPKLSKGKYPVRISKIDKKTEKRTFQFAYLLDQIPRDSKPSGKFTVNGLPEILNIGKNQFLFMERSYASGHKDGGNNVKIYHVDCTNATDIKNTKALKHNQYIPAKKKLILDFEEIRSKLTNGIVDNFEGITFGPKLKNGNKTLIVVSDNNFNKFGKQLSQIIVFEIFD